MTSSYQGISQGNRGFNPDPTPDYTAQIQRRNQELQRSIDRFNDSVNANDAARMANAQRAGDDMKALGQLSQTLGYVLGEVQKERIKKFQNQAKLLKAAGLDTPEKVEAARKEQDRQEEELRETNAELNKVKDKMVKNQEPFNIIDDVGKLNGYHIAELNRLNIIEKSKTYDQGVKDYIAEQVQSGRDASPDAQVGYAKEYTTQFLSELQDFSSPLIAKYALPYITEGQDKRIQAIRTQQAEDVSAMNRADATTKLIETGDAEAYLNSVRFTVDGNGNMLGYAGALNEMENVIRRQATARQPIDFDKLGESNINDGKKLKDHPRFAYFKQIYDDIQGQNFDKDMTNRRRDLEQIELNFHEQGAKRGYVYTDEDIERLYEEYGKDYSKGELKFLDDYKTSQERDAEDDKKALQELLIRKKYLVEEDLRGVHPDAYIAYMNVVRETEPLAKAEGSYNSKFETEANRFADKIYTEEVGSKDKTPQWGIAQRKIKDKLLERFNQNLENGMDAEMAYRDAVQDQFIAFGGTGAIPPEKREEFASVYVIETDTAFANKIAQTANYVREAVLRGDDLSTSLIPGTYKELKQLDEYNAGRGEIPELYYKVARNVKNLSAWDIANSQYKAYTGNELGKTSSEKARDQMSPALRAALDYKPTRSKIFRANEDADFNDPLLTSVSNPDLVRQAAAIVRKYESGAAGANAVNQIGIDGGHGTKGFSGDFRDMPQHGGRDLRDLSLSEIMELQAEADMSDGQWIREGKLHAVGDYQFVGKTLRGLVNRLGLPLSTKFTEEVQLAMFISLLKSGGPGQWIGLTKATANEMAVIEAARNSL